MEWHDMLLRLIAAAALPAAIGWDREARRKPAGLRTHMLVGLGAAGFVVIGLSMLERPPASEGDVLTLDPLRLLDGLIGGIGFLGAGSIIQARGRVEGVTTAAGIWSAAAIGAACGVGRYDLALMLTVLAAIVMLAFIPVKARIVEASDGDGGERGDA
ncbi:MAG: MgtC/SapB family protein [Phycisphaerales bacterium]